MSSARRVVVDLNILVAAFLQPSGWTARVLGRVDMSFHFPDWLLDEFEAHQNLLAERARCPVSEVHERLRRLLAPAHVVPRQRWAQWVSHPRVLRALSVDGKDSPDVATALAVDAGWIWTQDQALQSAFPGWAVPYLPDGAPAP